MGMIDIFYVFIYLFELTLLKQWHMPTCGVLIQHSYILRVVLVIIMEIHWLIGRVL